MLGAKSASISVFYAMVLLCIIIFCFSIVDIIRIQMAQSQSTRALSLASKSVMADFDSQLAREYGIFGYEMTDKEAVNETARYYYGNSLSPDITINRYGFQKVKSSFDYPLITTDYVNKQIMSYMKLRGPYLVLEQFLEQMDYFSKASKSAKVIAVNNQVAAEVDAANASYIKFEKLVDGIIVDGQNVVLKHYDQVQVYENYMKKLVPDYTGVNETGIPDEVTMKAVEAKMYHFPKVVDGIIGDIESGYDTGDLIVDKSKEYANKAISLEKLVDKKWDLMGKIYGFGAAPYSEDEIDAYKERLSEVREDISTLKEEMEELESTIKQYGVTLEELEDHIVDACETYINTLTEEMYYDRVQHGLLGINKEAIIELETVQCQLIQATSSLEELEATYNESKDLCIPEVAIQIKDNIDEYRAYLAQYSGSTDYAMAYYYGANLENELSFFDESKTVLESNQTLLEGLSGAVDTVMNHVEQIDNGWVQIENMDTESELYEETAKVIRRFTDASVSSTDYGDAVIYKLVTIKSAMYSYRTDLLIAYSEMGVREPPITYDDLTLMLESEVGLKLPDIDTYLGEEDLPSDICNEQDLPIELPSTYDMAGGIAMFKFVDEIGSALLEGTTDPLGQIYLNEYIMGMFSCFTTGLSEEEETASLTGVEFKDHCFDTEIEYILFGNKIAYLNVAAAAAVIFCLRLVLNCVHIMISTDKMSTVTDLAAAIAGWWSLGIGTVPVAAILVYLWAAIESIADIVSLLSGESVPYIKRDADWTVSMDGFLDSVEEQVAEEVTEGVTEGKDTDKNAAEEALSFTYRDYLRLLLYLPLTEKDSKLLRIMDLIQLNLSYSRKEDVYLKDYYYGLDTEIEVKVPLLFFELPFMPEGIGDTLSGYSFTTESFYCYQ